MLSVCIPVFNSNVEQLVKTLCFQKSKLKHIVEIIIIDDASDVSFKEQNRTLGKYIDRYVELDENVGRARIRNLFLNYATKPNLLFIDSDAIIDNSGFLGLYIESLKNNPGSVIMGGGIYSDTKPCKNKLLRWRYGHKTESKSAVVRSRTPYKSFITKNFIIPKETLQRVPFNESLSGYGHEDTLMGYNLKRAEINIVNIDNGVVNEDLDTNEEFLFKSAEAVKSLFKVLDIVNGDPDFISDIRLLVTVQKLYKIKLQAPVYYTLRLILPLIKFYMLKILPDLFLFNLYKLYYALKYSLVKDSRKCFQV